MKHLIKAVLRAVWQLTSPIRRPLVRKTETFLHRCIAQSVSQIQSPQINHVCEVTEETNLVMDHLIREVVRLQGRIEILQQSIETLCPHATEEGVAAKGTDADSNQ